MDIRDLEEIARLKQEDLDKIKRSISRKRSDAGVKRVKYDSKLPPKYRSYLMRANKKQLSFELSVDEFMFICSKNCVYCGSSSRVGVDRRDSSDGYTLENSQPCCSTCNMMKFTSDHESFLKQVDKIYRNQSR